MYKYYNTTIMKDTINGVLNPNSGKVMKKSGLLYEGTLLEAGKNNTGICDMAIYGITRKVYRMKKGEQR